MPSGIEIGQGLISGIFTGAIFACLSVGFSLTWGITKVLNVSHATFVLLGSYCAYWLLTYLNLDPVISVVVTLPLFFVIGMAFYQYVIKATVKTARDITLSSTVLTFGIAMVIENLLLYFVKGDVRLINTSYTGQSWFLGGVAFPLSQMVSFVIAAATIAGIYFFLHYTHTGKQVVAVWQNTEGAMLSGINIGNVNRITYGLAFASAATGGLCMALTYAFYPTIHLSWLIFIFLVVIFGGVGSILGCAVSGLIIGLVQSLGGTFFSFSWMNFIMFVLLIVILLVRPSGLMQR